MSRVTWADYDGHKFFLVSWGTLVSDGDQEVGPFGFASLGTIVRKIRDDSFYADMAGEEADVINVWRLTDQGPVPVTITYHSHSDMVECRFRWRQPGIRGTKGNRVESGFYQVAG